MATRKEIEPYDGPKDMGHESRVPAVLEQVTNCGYCHQRVSPDRASYRQHVMSCVGHPAYALAQALREVGELAQEGKLYDSCFPYLSDILEVVQKALK